jgi:hypothetical protein
MQVTRMHYRGKRYIVTIAPDGGWTWVVVLSACLSVKGYAITKFEAIDQATHVIDRMVNLGARRTIPCSRLRLARIVPSFFRKEALALLNCFTSRRVGKVFSAKSAAWATLNDNRR